MPSKKIRKSVLALCIIGVVACNKKVTTLADSPTPSIQKDSITAENIATQDSIIFIFFNIQKDTSQQKTSVQLVEIKKVKGKVKSDPLTQYIDTDNYLEVLFLDNGKNIIKEGKIEHPLHPKMEYLDEDGKFKWATPTLYETEFSIRIQWDKRYSAILFKSNTLDTAISLF